MATRPPSVKRKEQAGCEAGNFSPVKAQNVRTWPDGSTTERK